MKISGETKLLVGLFVFAVLGGGFLFFSNRLSNPPEPPRIKSGISAAALNDLVRNARHAKGAPEAAPVIVEFADFQCPSCRRAYASIAARLGKTIPARFIFHHLPLVKEHPMAFPAAMAAEAAGRQGKFWEMYDALFDPKAPPLDAAYLEKSARRIGLDMARFDRDRKDPALEAPVRDDIRIAGSYGVTETPTFFVRDRSGAVSQVVGGDALQGLLVEKKLLPAPRAADPRFGYEHPGKAKPVDGQSGRSNRRSGMREGDHPAASPSRRDGL